MHLELEFVRSFVKLHRPLVNQLNKQLQHYDLYNAQWTVLSLLSRCGEMTSAEIAEEQMVEKPSITKIVKRLHEMGYIEVTQGQDKREKLLRLSEEGRRTTEAIQEKLLPLYERILEGIPREEIESAKRLLDQAYQNLMN
ncbi:putative HTH-type transcriptional regulator YwoH [Sporosarcina sp. NCCP-2716]|uniref:MarR family winged helix-turn-helix transcriptional regulator n=1 Tax=Sporosarcina sp. NCCP-2716 TaxID=2943679 RepID=UPI00203C0F49|nr:MarR family transcriptional regulator [Sporosarcina sp. NCCP-2716]GKV68684.1 putative HTH-type transcriptional regulator YwoH [Sporosarcina sp. NCCP-2716]